MRPFLLPLALVSAAVAADPFEEVYRDFQRAEKEAYAPGARARILPALARLAETRDARAIGPVAALVVRTLAEERKLLDAMKEVEARGVVAFDTKEATENLLKVLIRREKAGSTTVGPEIDKCNEEIRGAGRIMREVAHEAARKSEQIEFGRMLRESATEACIALLKAQEGEKARRGAEQVERAFDIADPEQSLFIVRIIRSSGRTEAAPQLINIANHTRAAAATRSQAVRAVAELKETRSLKALLRMWETQPEVFGKVVRGALSRAAKRRLNTIEDAGAWIEGLPR